MIKCKLLIHHPVVYTQGKDELENSYCQIAMFLKHQQQEYQLHSWRITTCGNYY